MEEVEGPKWTGEGGDGRLRRRRTQEQRLVLGGGKCDSLWDLVKGGNSRRLAERLAAQSDDVNAPDGMGNTALHYAAWKGFRRSCITLLRAKADPLVVNNGGAQPIHVAHAGCVGCLVEHGADSSTCDGKGLTALHRAALAGNLAKVQALLEWGADPTVGDQRGKRPVVYGEGEEIRRILKMVELFSEGEDVRVDLKPETLRLDRLNRYCGIDRVRYLSLRGFGLNHVPPALGRLPNLRSVDLSGNQLSGEVIKALQTDPQQFLAGIRRGRGIPHREVKVMVVGQENVGKTCLVRWLKKSRNKSVDLHTVTSDGIDVDRFEVTAGDAADGAVFQCWDFAGQELYHLTHHFFITSGGIYLVLFDLRYPLEDSRVDFWLQSIHGRGEGAPVAMVGTHLDDKCATQEHLNAVTAEVVRYKKRYRNISGVMFVSCQTGAGVTELQEGMLRMWRHRNVLIPNEYLLLGNRLEALAEEYLSEGLPPVCERAVASAAAQESLGWTANDKRLEAALCSLNTHGKIVYLGRRGGRAGGHVVLRPQFLARCFACIVTQNSKNFAKNGILRHQDFVSFVLRQNGFSTSLDAYLLSLLEAYEVIHPSLGHPGCYLVPCMFDPARPSGEIDNVLRRHATAVVGAREPDTELHRRWVFQVMPSGLMARIVIRVLSLFSKHQLVYWRDGVVVQRYDALGGYFGCLLLELVQDEDLRPTVSLRVLVPGLSLAARLFIAVSDLLTNLLEDWYHLSPESYSVWVVCAVCEPATAHRFPINECQRLAYEGNESVTCPGCSTLHPLESLAPDALLVDVISAGCERVQFANVRKGRLLGTGASGTVYRGVYNDQEVAVKVIKGKGLDLKALKDFQHEVRLSASLKHPNVVATLGFSLQPFAVLMECLDGGDLHSLLVDPKHLSRLLGQLNDGLAVLQKQRVEWRDFGHISEEDFLGTEALVREQSSRLLLEIRRNAREYGSLSAGTDAEDAEVESLVDKVDQIALARMESDTKELSVEYDGARQRLEEWYSRVRRANPLTPARRIKYALDVARGMQFLHSRFPAPILHRDLKSPNIMLTGDYESYDRAWAKITDFGVSSRLVLSELQVDRVAKHVVANPRWLAPEILSGGTYSQPSDVYAFGVILWELASRDLPFGEGDYLQVTGSILGQSGSALEAPSHVSKAYRLLMEACCQTNPEKRPRFRSVVDSLEELGRRHGVVCKGLPTPRSARGRESKGAGSSRIKGRYEEVSRKGPLKLGEQAEAMVGLADGSSVWLGTREGTLQVVDILGGDFLQVVRQAHGGEDAVAAKALGGANEEAEVGGGVSDLTVSNGRVWSCGGDGFIRVWHGSSSSQSDTREAVLEFRGKNLRGVNWKTYQVELYIDSQTLVWKSDRKVKGEVLLHTTDAVHTAVVQDGDRGVRITVTSKGEDQGTTEYVFRAPTPTEAQSWVARLQGVVNQKLRPLGCDPTEEPLRHIASQGVGHGVAAYVVAMSARVMYVYSEATLQRLYRLPVAFADSDPVRECRALAVWGSRAFVASGPCVYTVELAQGRQSSDSFGGASAPVTTLACTETEGQVCLWAGCEDGTVCLWSVSAPSPFPQYIFHFVDQAGPVTALLAIGPLDVWCTHASSPDVYEAAIKRDQLSQILKKRSLMVVGGRRSRPSPPERVTCPKPTWSDTEIRFLCSLNDAKYITYLTTNGTLVTLRKR